MKRGLRTIGMAIGMALVTGLASNPASAQPGGGFGGGGFGRGMFGETINSRDMQRYQDFLRLTPEQREMVKVLFDGYTAQSRDLGEAMRKKMEQVRNDFQDTRDPSVWQGLQGAMEQMRASRQKMESSFMDDFKAVLTAEQATRWPELERTMRRDRMLPRGLMSGERLDVIRLVEDANLPPEARANAELVLEQYKVDLDRALVKRTEVTEDAMRQAGELFRTGDMERAQGLLEKARSASSEVRDLNRRYARQIEALLPDDKKAAWQDAVKRASFPQVYRPSLAGRSLEAAAGFGDLDDSQRTAIEALRGSYLRDSSGINDKLAAAQEDMENTMTVGQMMRRGRGGPDDGPMGDLRRQRRDLDRTALDNLKKILKPGQIERLPQDQADDQGGPRQFGPGGPGGGRRGGNGGDGQDGNQRPPRRGGIG
jgi:Spy/CpxP family protein refolding chaperone